MLSRPGRNLIAAALALAAFTVGIAYFVRQRDAYDSYIREYCAAKQRELAALKIVQAKPTTQSIAGLELAIDARNVVLNGLGGGVIVPCEP